MSHPDLPEAEIQFAAKMGFITREIWTSFFNLKSQSWQSRQWRLLLKRGYFRRHTSMLAQDVYVLNHKSVDVKRVLSKQGVAAPGISQLSHDVMTARVLLALMKANLVRSYETEAELKERASAASFGIEKVGGKNKFPDAILQMKTATGIMTVALEVELTQKSARRYRGIMDAYSLLGSVDMVIFVVGSNGIFSALRNAMSATNFPFKRKQVGFVSPEKILKEPANCQISFVGKTKSLSQIASERPLDHAY